MTLKPLLHCNLHIFETKKNLQAKIALLDYGLKQMYILLMLVQIIQHRQIILNILSV